MADGERRGACCGGRGGRLGGGGDCKRKRENRCDRDTKSSEYCALAASVATLSKNVNVIATQMRGKSGEDDDAKPPDNGKMASNAKKSALCKIPKKEKE